MPLVDLERMAANLDRMAAYGAVHGLALRPHVKTHKARHVAAQQLGLGAIGVTCATLRELEVMSDVSSDLLLAYPPVGVNALTRLLALPDETKLTVAVDSAEAIEELAQACRLAGREVGVYVELDVGMRRTGVADATDAARLVRQVLDRPSLRYAGVMFYPGHVRQPGGEQGPALAELSRTLGTVLEGLTREGLGPRVVSGGSTPAAWRMHEVAGVTEIRPGTYVYNDRTTAGLGVCHWEDVALSVLATVVSTAVPGQAVVNAGSKALGREPLDGAPNGGWGDGFAALLDRPGVRVVRMSEEHGVLDLSGTSWRPTVGERVRIVPNHACICVHLHETVVGVRNDVIETSWRVDARGRAHAS